MRIFAVGTKIFGGPGQHLGGLCPPRPQRRTAPGQLILKVNSYQVNSYPSYLVPTVNSSYPSQLVCLPMVTSYPSHVVPTVNSYPNTKKRKDMTWVRLDLEYELTVGIRYNLGTKSTWYKLTLGILTVNQPNTYVRLESSE